MKCSRFAFRAGTGEVVTGFICGRKDRVKTCVHCGRPPSKLCDFPLKGAKAGKTCDRPVCEQCATHVEPDTDYCMTHAAIIEKDPQQGKLAL